MKLYNCSDLVHCTLRVPWLGWFKFFTDLFLKDSHIVLISMLGLLSVLLIPCVCGHSVTRLIFHSNKFRHQDKKKRIKKIYPRHLNKVFSLKGRNRNWVRQQTPEESRSLQRSKRYRYDNQYKHIGSNSQTYDSSFCCISQSISTRPKITFPSSMFSSYITISHNGLDVEKTI